jgi:predicted nucleic acid-binding protein
MTRYLLDTNHLGEAIRKVSRVRDRVHQSERKGHRFGSCAPALCELEVGIQQTSNAQASRRRLYSLFKVVRLWPIDEEIAPIYGTLYLALRKRGKAISFVDLILASLAVHIKCTLLTTDRDFEALPEVPTENWVS